MLIHCPVSKIAHRVVWYVDSTYAQHAHNTLGLAVVLSKLLIRAIYDDQNCCNACCLDCTHWLMISDGVHLPYSSSELHKPAQTGPVDRCLPLYLMRMIGSHLYPKRNHDRPSLFTSSRC